jgi:hypothetical protein
VLLDLVTQEFVHSRERVGVTSNDAASAVDRRAPSDSATSRSMRELARFASAITSWH